MNSMCLNCAKLGNGCKGTENPIYSGCIYKEECKMSIVAQDIFNQLGGNRFRVMTGSTGFIWDESKQTLRIVLARNGSKANRLDIIYNPDDTYTMNFYRFTPYRVKVDHAKGEVKTYPEKITEVRRFEHIYCDQLQELFTEVTGMYTRL